MLRLQRFGEDGICETAVRGAREHLQSAEYPQQAVEGGRVRATFRSELVDRLRAGSQQVRKARLRRDMDGLCGNDASP
jgi:hypothetical protein